MAPNIPEMLECHYGVPMAGAVLNAINIRLDAASVRFVLEHSDSKVLIADRAYSKVVKEALNGMTTPPTVVDIVDSAHDGEPMGSIAYDELVDGGSEAVTLYRLADEWQAIALNYTSGTTGNPKGAVISARSAYLNALAGVLATEMTSDSVYLWTLPMFHCNGWCFTWGVTAVGATHVCLRQVEPTAVFEQIATHRVTTLCGAPVILNMLVHAPVEAPRPLETPCTVFTGGAAPPTAVIAGMERLGFSVVQLYGLTESSGPSLLCVPQPAWQGLPLDQRAPYMARQGVSYPLLDEVIVGDRTSGTELPRDGQSLGEIMLRGNSVMKGYLKNPAANDEVFANDWFCTGDLAVRHPDGSIEVKDRSKDIIISGGENISSLEVEEVLYSHPSVLEAAVVARPHDHWGETPFAFVTLRDDSDPVTETDLIAYCRNNMAHFKAPRAVAFGPIPKTATGKIQKYELRERARALGVVDPE